MTVFWGRTLLGEGRRQLASGSARRGAMVVMAAGMAVLCAGLLTGAAPGSARARAPRVQWGTAVEVPGLKALGSRIFWEARVNSLSCWSVNNCAAGGWYADPSGSAQAFVAVEQEGRWHKAVEVPGLGALNTGANEYTGASVYSVSCAAGGYCVAGGYYTDGSEHVRAFVSILANGRWQLAEEPALAALGAGMISSVSCPSAGNCVIGGSAAGEAFVVSQVSGAWGAAQEIPGIYTVSSLSCWSAGNCAAADEGSVVSEENGVWGTAEPVPGTADLYGTVIDSLSCAHDGYCAVGGWYEPTSYRSYPFVATEQNGVWGAAVEWSGGPVLTSTSQIASVSCASAGSCAAVGFDRYGGIKYTYQSFVVDQKNGAWGTPRLLTGSPRNDKITSVSCPSAGDCRLGGSYVPASNRREPFVAIQTNGRWGKAKLVPGIRTLNKHSAIQTGIVSVTCPSVVHCSAAGTYTNAGGFNLEFVTGR